MTANITNFAQRGACLSVCAGLLALGCDRGQSDPGTLPAGSKGETRACAGTPVVATDVNEDGRADIEHLERDGRRYCTRADMNFDGKLDVVRFYEADGVNVAQERFDFDFDGQLDQVSFYENGDLVRQELDTDFDNTIDTWLWCGGGWVVRAERDRRRDGNVDVWETYADGVLVEAEYDENNDGHVDRWDSFRDGQLIVTQYDEDRDGEPDVSEEMPKRSLGPADDALRCKGAPTAEVAMLSGRGAL